MEVIILAGGLGTRLQSILKGLPKPMVDINGKPFLVYLIEYLSNYNISKIVLSIGYNRDYIKEYFNNNYHGIEIVYSLEDTPLGTGGAVKKALNATSGSNVIVLNGDSLFTIDLDLFSKLDNSYGVVMAVKPMSNFDRYGCVEIMNNKVISFKEKQKTKEGYINAGVYMINKDIFNNIKEEKFSLESFLQSKLDISTYMSTEYFIDIGIPSDYEKAKISLEEIF